jgi:L-alanine-DL-glutamate epimerase-like enolase superfamily enzyme
LENVVRIERVESFTLHVPTPRYVEDSFNTGAAWGVTGVQLHTDEGLVGTGYTGTLTHGDGAIRKILDHIYAPLLVGEDATLHERIWRRLYWSDAHWIGRTGITQMALAAVDIAVWDLRAQAFELPLWKLVGGDKDGRVRSYNTDGGWLNFDVDRLVREMTTIVEQGWTAVKMKVGKANTREDYERVKSVRKALGDDVALMIDANQIWDLTTARTWAPRLEEFDITWLEEPLNPDDVPSHAKLARSTSIPIALGEHVYSRTSFRDYLQNDAISYVQADCTRLGGVTEWLAVAEIAQAFDTPVVPHHADMMRVHQHLGVGHPACPMIECIPWLQEIFEEPADIRDGWFYVPDTPGASTTIRQDKFDEFRVA